MGVCTQRHTKGSRKTEIRKLQVALLIDEQVLRLEITVQYAMTMAVSYTFDQLCHELLDDIFPESDT